VLMYVEALCDLQNPAYLTDMLEGARDAETISATMQKLTGSCMTNLELSEMHHFELCTLLCSSANAADPIVRYCTAFNKLGSATSTARRRSSFVIPTDQAV
jgi:hypothetical protein